MRRKRIFLILAAFLLVSLVGVGFWSFTIRAKESPYMTGTVQKGNVTQLVTATGSLSAVVTVQVGSQVSGMVSELYADFNSKVKEGQVVAKLDQDKFKAAVEQAKANVISAQAAVAKSQVSVEDSRRTLERSKELRKRNLTAQSDLDAAETAYNSAVAQLEVNKAQVEMAKAALEQAAVDLNRTVIRSPVAGIVISRNIDVGQTVAASLQAPVLFLIANDLAKMQVDTNVSEGDVGNVWVDQEVTFTVDAYPTRRFRGKVLQVRNAPIMVQNVVTYDAVVGVDNKDLLLKPGMTANVEFLVNTKSDVLKVPNAALRFRPPSDRPQPETTPQRVQLAVPGTTRPASRNLGQGGRGGGARPNREGTLYVLRDEKLTPVKVRLGISDGTFTEITGDDIREGNQVVLTMSGTNQARPTALGGMRLFR